jgi:hypothetical protein
VVVVVLLFVFPAVVLFGAGEEDEPNSIYEREMSAITPSTIAAISLLRSAGVLPSNKAIRY